MIAQLRAYGVATKMLTGDAVPVASAVARQVGLGAIGILPGGDAELLPAIDRLDGFAQVYPQDKHRVIQACQARGRIVGMTGDGVNDAPALKQAEVGIAMSTATDAAKAAASSQTWQDPTQTGKGSSGGFPNLIRIRAGALPGGCRVVRRLGERPPL
jgi:H+-transporting ATPase